MRLIWASAAEGMKLAKEINRMVEDVRALGPLNWPGVVAPNGDAPLELTMVAEEVAA